MLLEVKKYPESIEVEDDSRWFPIQAGDPDKNPLGFGAYARIIDTETKAKNVKRDLKLIREGK